MKYKEFRNFKIVRSCKEEFADYHDYKSYLKNDFHERCAYCNTKDSLIAPEPFHIDHFIPRKSFQKNFKELEGDYNNLMYCCPKCNATKGQKFQGNIQEKKYQNDLFYNPVDVDYNQIFYRDEYGGISSDEEKGREMISRLRLFSPIYKLAFLLEEIENVKVLLSKKIDSSFTQEMKNRYLELYFKLDAYYIFLKNIFNLNYHNVKKLGY